MFYVTVDKNNYRCVIGMCK